MCDVIAKRLHGANFAPRIHMLRKLARSMKKFVKDNPIASSRRNTPVQGQKITANRQEPNQQPLFPHLPVQCFNPTVILHITTNTVGPQEQEHESREHSRKSPQKSNKGGTDSDVKTTPSPEKLSRRSNGSTLPETPTVCRDTSSPILTANANRSK